VIYIQDIINNYPTSALGITGLRGGCVADLIGELKDLIIQQRCIRPHKSLLERQALFPCWTPSAKGRQWHPRLHNPRERRLTKQNIDPIRPGVPLRPVAKDAQVQRRLDPAEHHLAVGHVEGGVRGPRRGEPVRPRPSRRGDRDGRVGEVRRHGVEDGRVEAVVVPLCDVFAA